MLYIPEEPQKINKNQKSVNSYVLCYGYTSPLDVPSYAFGQTKSSQSLDFARFIRSSSFFPIPLKSSCKKTFVFYSCFFIFLLLFIIMVGKL